MTAFLERALAACLHDFKQRRRRQFSSYGQAASLMLGSKNEWVANESWCKQPAASQILAQWGRCGCPKLEILWSAFRFDTPALVAESVLS